MKMFFLLYSILMMVQLTAPAIGQPAVGESAPLFNLPYATKDSIHRGGLKLDEILGTGNIVLAFYPANWSGGCTKEMCALRDDFSSLAELDVVILGISGDYVFSHHEWAKHLQLPFGLLSDHDHSVARLYNSYNPETGYNRRTVFVIDRSGRIAYADTAYSVGTTKSFDRLKAALSSIR